MSSWFYMHTYIFLFALIRLSTSTIPTGTTFKSPALDGSNKIIDAVREPRQSYVIYDNAEHTLPGKRPFIFQSPRPWHLEFNQRMQPDFNNRLQKPYPTVAYQAVYSNLIQVYDKPQSYVEKKYFGNEYNDYQPKPQNVPNYEVIYPNGYDQRNIYYSEKIPNDFPRPFNPNKDYNPTRTINVPTTKNRYHTEAVSFLSTADRPCNYIRLNEKGFPPGNEKCGRSVSDILLPEDYPNNIGQAIMEHRKQFRVQQRSKRSPMDMTAGGYGYPDLSTQACCGFPQNNNYRPYYHGYNTPNQFDNRPNRYQPEYQESTKSYEQYEDNDEGQETTTKKKGLSSYLNSRGYRNRGKSNNEDDDESGENNDSSSKRLNQNGHRPKNNSARSGNSTYSYKNSRAHGNSQMDDSDREYPNLRNYHMENRNHRNDESRYGYNGNFHRQYHTGNGDDRRRGYGFGDSFDYNNRRYGY